MSANFFDLLAGELLRDASTEDLQALLAAVRLLLMRRGVIAA